jgi:hypothetical protein
MTMGVESFFFENFETTNSCGVNLYVRCEEAHNKQVLFDTYGVGLDAPQSYFGLNWDAFSDCLTGLEWISERQINIVHDGLPLLTDQDLAIYLEILASATSEWNNKRTDKLARYYRNFKAHNLAVYFPYSVKSDVERILKEGRYSI